MRDKLQALVDECNGQGIASIEWLFSELESILATESTAVTVNPGWIAKDTEGVAWYSSKPSYRKDCEWWDSNGSMYRFLDGAITDLWPDYPNGGPECCMEVK